MDTKRMGAIATLFVLLILAAGLVLARKSVEAYRAPASDEQVMPQYDDEGILLLPSDYRLWRFVDVLSYESRQKCIK